LQSDKLATDGDTVGQFSHDAVTTAACHGHNLLFPTYDGTEDPLSWLNQCAQFFRIRATEDAGKVFFASFYMTGDAAQWSTLLEKNRGTSTWMEFEQLVHQRFSPSLRDSTVVEYQNKFLQLVNQCVDLSEKHQINIFTDGLCNLLKTDVELEQPATLEEAMALARAYEQWLAMPDDMASRAPTRAAYSRPMSKSLALPAPPPASGGSTSTIATLPSAPCLKCLTTVEMAAKWEKGECYNCIEQFSWQHLKVCPM
jgi:hypothetical protein